jgi:hypothetical protein
MSKEAEKYDTIVSTDENWFPYKTALK